MLYFDNAATTQMHPRVVEAMTEWQNYANAGSVHRVGVEARRQIDNARKNVAALLNCSEDQVIFTSGGSESNATVMRGFKRFFTEDRCRVLYSAVEHESVKKNAEIAHKIYGNVREPHSLPVSKIGTLLIDRMDSAFALHEDVGLVSVMASNNEIPAINNVSDIAEIVHEHGAAFHTDCVQAVGSIDLDVQKLKCDYLSLSAHKFHGPKGVGVLYCRDKSTLIPLIGGGESQEFGMRGGTENVAGIIGLGKAAEMVMLDREYMSHQIEMCKSLFVEKLMECVEKNGISQMIQTNGAHTVRGTKIVSVTFRGVDAQSMVFALSAQDVFVSAGSACNAHSSEASETLLALGMTPKDAHSTIRVSFSALSRMDEAEKCAEIIADTAARLSKARIE